MIKLFLLLMTLGSCVLTALPQAFADESFAVITSNTNFLGMPELYKELTQEGSALKFNVSKLPTIADQTQLPLLLIGEDNSNDPESFKKYALAHPEQKILKRYIHRVTKTSRALPKGSISFFTAFDLALMEVEEGRLTAEQAVRVGQAILAAPDFSNLFSVTGLCPTTLTFVPGATAKKDAGLVELAEVLTEAVQSYCISVETDYLYDLFSPYRHF